MQMDQFCRFNARRRGEALAPAHVFEDEGYRHPALSLSRLLVSYLAFIPSRGMFPAVPYNLITDARGGQITELKWET